MLEPMLVFAGPSLPHIDPAVAEQIELRPPMKRGDAAALLERDPGLVVLIDGVFSSELAVAPAECRALLDGGWTVVGAASIGALRAAELWAEGMIGIGEVFALYRLGVLDADADVAVAIHPQTYAELSLALVHLRSLARDLVDERGLAPSVAATIVDHARRIHFLQRDWPRCRTAWAAAGLDQTTLEVLDRWVLDPGRHPKVRDATLALRTCLARVWISRR